MSDDLFLAQYDGGWLGLEQGGAIRRMTDGSRSMDWLLSANAPRAADLIATLRDLPSEAAEAGAVEAPVGRQEIWGAGVTYKRSEEAREAEFEQQHHLHPRVQRGSTGSVLQSQRL